jgi:hypothetical protein
MGRQAVWLEVPLVELMLTAIRPGSLTKRRQEKIVSLKTFAYGYRLGVNSKLQGRQSVACPPVQAIRWTQCKSAFADPTIPETRLPRAAPCADPLGCPRPTGGLMRQWGRNRSFRICC